MNLAELNEAFGYFKPDKITSAVDLAIGLSNTSYLLTTSSGERYVLRLLRLQSPGNARAEAKIQKNLSGCGINCPQYLELQNGDIVGRAGQHNFTLSTYIQGKRAEKPTLPLARNFGVVLAKIHSGLTKQRTLIEPNDDQWLRLEIARKEVARCPSELRSLLSPRLETSRAILGRNLPQSIIHADLGIDNSFVENDQVTAVFDFETAEYTVRLLDIAQTYLTLAWPHVLNPHKIKESLFDGYNATAPLPLTPEEHTNFQQALVYVAVSCAAWVQNNDADEYVKPFLEVAEIL